VNHNITPIFSSFVYEDILDVDLELLEETCYDVFSKDPDPNVGRFDFSDMRFNPLLVEVDKRLQYVHKQFGFKHSMIQKFMDGWVSINKNFYADTPHQHPQTSFSSVFYVKAPDGCDVLEFINPNPVVQWVDRNTVHSGKEKNRVDNCNQYSSSTWQVIPEPGKLVIFPSWLWHYKYGGTTTEDRIAIAFDSVADEL
jgi:uncharacterized protein (TIGR02466 family)